MLHGWNIYLHNWLIFRLNVGKYSIHSASGLSGGLIPDDSKKDKDRQLRIAAKAAFVAWTCCTFLSHSWAEELSPTESGLPHVTTDLSARIAAKAALVPWASHPWVDDRLKSCPSWVECPITQLTHQPRWQQKHYLRNKSAAHSWVGLALQSCHHHNVDPPMSRLIHQSRWQQKHLMWPEHAGHVWADIGLRSGHHHHQEHPTWRLIRQSRWQPMQPVWLESCARSWDGLARQSYHHRNLDSPMSRLIHQTRWQQMPYRLPEPWADVGLQSCHHRLQDLPMSPLLHQPRLRRRHYLLTEHSAHSRAYVEPQSYHHQSLDPPHVKSLSPPQHHKANAYSVAASFACCTTAARWCPPSYKLVYNPNNYRYNPHKP